MYTMTIVEMILIAVGRAFEAHTDTPIVFRVPLDCTTQTSDSTWVDLPRLTGET